MTTEATIIVVIAATYWLAIALFCSWLAGAKGRDIYGWGLLGFFFGVIALLTIIGAPVLEEELEPEPEPEEPRRRGVRRSPAR